MDYFITFDAVNLLSGLLSGQNDMPLVISPLVSVRKAFKYARERQQVMTFGGRTCRPAPFSGFSGLLCGLDVGAANVWFIG